MRVAVLSDIHGNLQALEKVLADVAGAGAESLCSLGDIVGYGPDPGACVEAVRERFEVSLTGNHDAASVGRTSLDEFNEFARWSIEWTAVHLTPAQKEYLRALPYVHREPRLHLLLAHASPVEPKRWHYIHGLADIEEHFAVFTERVCMVGHSHRPAIYELGGGAPAVRCGPRVRMREGRRYLVNAGSVGQPRDGKPLASYALYDDAEGSLEVRRVAYPVDRTQERMRRERIPEFLVERLAAGV